MSTDLFATVPTPDTATMDRLHARLVERADGEVCSTSRTAPSTARSAPCCWRRPRPASSASPSSARTTTRSWPRWRPPSAPASCGRRPASTPPPASSTSTSPGGAGASTSPVDLQLAHGFRRGVLEHLRDIEYGATESYAEVAAATGSPRAVRGRRQRLRHQPGPRGRPVPPRRPQRRHARRLPRRPRGQADPARPGERRDSGLPQSGRDSHQRSFWAGYVLSCRDDSRPDLAPGAVHVPDWLDLDDPAPARRRRTRVGPPAGADARRAAAERGDDVGAHGLPRLALAAVPLLPHGRRRRRRAR